MITYKYRCSSCTKELEIKQRIVDDPLVQCPKCNSPSLIKIIQLSSFTLTGEGWTGKDIRASSFVRG